MQQSKKRGAILLVASTCVGSGIIALPMVLAQFGVIYSTILLLLIWSLTYYTALINIELNLRAGRGMPLVELAELFGGKMMRILSIINLKGMSYLLLAAFIYGSSSILQKIFLQLNHGQSHIDIFIIITGYTIIAAILLLLPVRHIDYINRILFLGLIGVILALSAGLLITINWSTLPLFPQLAITIRSVTAVIPVIFTCFGFQVIFHTLTEYTGKNISFLRSAVLWGSLIPALIYIIWTTIMVSTIYTHNAAFYQEMVAGTASVGDLIYELGIISNSPYIQMLIWSISLLAVITSVIGIGMGSRDSMEVMLRPYIYTPLIRRLSSVILTLMPSYLMIFLVSDAFMQMLGLAGAMLVFIAIIIPIYLFIKSNKGRFFYQELSHRWLVIIALLAGGFIIICQAGSSLLA